MKQKLLFFLFAPFFTMGQNTWDGSVIPTITTNGSVTIGTLASPFANLNVVNTTKSYGIYLTSNANLAQSQYGIFNTMSVNNNSGIKYGIYNQMIGNTSGVKYGVYSSLQSNGGTSNSYGIYSSVSGSSARAAYFSGNVDMYRSNTIYTATNGSKFMLFSNHTSTSPNSYAISFVPNVTNNQEDWHWGRTLELYRDGSMIKNVTSADQAFTIRRSDWAEDVFRVYGDGKLYAAEINVRLLGDFPDYVFRSDGICQLTVV